MAPLEIVFGDCAASANAVHVRRTARAAKGAPAHGRLADERSRPSRPAPLSDTGYTLTFGGGGLQGSDVSPFSDHERHGRRSGSVAETAKGAAGLLPAGTVATAGTVADTGYTLTFGGSHEPGPTSSR